MAQRDRNHNHNKNIEQQQQPPELPRNPPATKSKSVIDQEMQKYKEIEYLLDVIKEAKKQNKFIVYKDGQPVLSEELPEEKEAKQNEQIES